MLALSYIKWTGLRQALQLGLASEPPTPCTNFRRCATPTCVCGPLYAAWCSQALALPLERGAFFLALVVNYAPPSTPSRPKIQPHYRGPGKFMDAFIRGALASHSTPTRTAGDQLILRDGPRHRILVSADGNLTPAGRSYQAITGEVLPTRRSAADQ